MFSCLKSSWRWLWLFVTPRVCVCQTPRAWADERRRGSHKRSASCGSTDQLKEVSFQGNQCKDASCVGFYVNFLSVFETMIVEQSDAQRCVRCVWLHSNKKSSDLTLDLTHWRDWLKRQWPLPEANIVQDHETGWSQHEVRISRLEPTCLSR